MSYNSIVSIPFGDLDRVSGAADFGAVLAGLARLAAQSDPDGVFSTDEHDPRAGFSVTVSGPIHASETSLHILRESGVSLRIRASEAGVSPLEDWICLARSLADLGYRSHSKAADILVEAEAAPEQTVETRISIDRARMLAHDAAPDRSMVSLILRHDAVDGLEGDASLGERLRDATRLLISSRATRPGHVDLSSICAAPSHLAVGNCCNGMSLIEVTPAGWADVAILDANRAGVIEAAPPLAAFTSDQKRKLHERLRASDIRCATRALAVGGFMVRAPGRVRSEPAASWNEKNWVRQPDALCDDPQI